MNLTALLPLAAIVAALVALLAARRASAAPSGPPVAAPPEPPGPPVSAPPAPTGMDAIIVEWSPAVYTYPAPMPPGAMFEILKTESAGKPSAVAYGQVAGGSEIGGTQLVVEHDENGTPNLSSKFGAIGADVDPLDRLGAIYGAQWVYQRARDQIAGELAERGMRVPSETEVRDWIVLMQSHHSIGPGALRMLLDGMARRGTTDPIVGLHQYATTIMPPAAGRQSADKVRMRIRRMLALPDRAAAIADLPASMMPLAARVPEVPRFDAARAKAAILAAKRRRS